MCLGKSNNKSMLNFYGFSKRIELLKNESANDLIDLSYKLGETSRKEVELILSKGSKEYAIQWKDRNLFTSKFGWSIPCKEAVDAIKKYAREPLYDAMAGTGFWAKILNLNGVKTIAYDLHSNTKKNIYHGNSNIKKHYKIKRKNALRLGYDLKEGRINGDIFLSWPPYECPTASDLLSMLPIGTRVFYIGEGQGGCTGDLSFHVNLNTNFKLLERVFLPNFPGIHDDMYIYEKIKSDEIDAKLKGKTFNFGDESEEEDGL